RQTAPDLQLSPDGKHVFFTVLTEPDSAKRPNVPNYVTESSYPEDIQARELVGDVQDRRTLAAMNLETGKTVTFDATFESAVAAPDRGAPAKRDVNWTMPKVSEDGAAAVAHVRAGDNKDRWFVAVDAESGKTRVIDALHD